jgi:hypothetical protein
MEAAKTPETLVNFYQTTRRYNPENSHLHSFKLICWYFLPCHFSADVLSEDDGLESNKYHFQKEGTDEKRRKQVQYSLTLSSRSSSKYLRIQSVPQRKRHTSPLQKSADQYC